MARIQVGTIVTDIRGKIGGSVFQKGPSGLIIRAGSRIINKRNELTSSRRVLMQSLQQSWGLISVAQRTAWSAWSVFSPIAQFNNAAKFLNGHQCYLRVNYYRSLYGFSVLTSPVFAKSTVGPVTVRVSNALDALFVTYTPTVDPAVTCMLIALSQVLPAGVNNGLRRVRQIIFVSDDGGGGDISNEVIALFGALPATSSRVYISYAAMDLSTGSISAFINEVQIVA